MEMNSGYKESEVGMIPCDWVVVPLSDCLSTSPSYGVNAPAVKYDSRFPTYIRITDITEDGKFSDESRASVVHPSAESYFLESGDLVFARTGASVGKSYLYDPKDGALVYAGFLIRIRPNPNKLAPKFLQAYAKSKTYWNWIKVNSMRSGQPGINGREYASLPLAIPSNRAEQEAIAEALSDADALIESLDQLISKKRHIKQGTMQELLTGKRRLPGFDGEWLKKSLGDLGEFLKGAGVSKDEALTGDLPCIRYGEIYTKHSDWIREFQSWVSTAVAATATRINYGDVLFAASGETKEEIGKCVAYVDQREAYAGGDIVILRTKIANPLFLGYYLNTESVRQQKSSRGQGDAVVHIGANSLAAIKIALPSMEEQTAIATILSDMDTELAALESRLAKARQIKQGMMQELLTGRIRLL